MKVKCAGVCHHIGTTIAYVLMMVNLQITLLVHLVGRKNTCDLLGGMEEHTAQLMIPAHRLILKGC